MTIRFFHTGRLIETISGGGRDAVWRIGKGGGEEQIDILLPAHSLLSRTHATLYFSSGRFWIEDRESTNGTFINGARLPAGIRQPLAAGDAIDLGRSGVQAIVEPARAVRREHTMLQCTGLRKTFPDGRPGFGPLNLALREGSFTGIMGPSGCGKSTLLRVLAGVSPSSGGSLLIGDHPAGLKPDRTRGLSGYVPQQDLVHLCLTVYEQLHFTARLRLPRLTKKETENRINRTLGRLHLSELRLRIIGQLSSGQRKRVAIAAELLAEPPLLLLDEPTSPLDPHSAATLRTILAELCTAGTTVVIVTHRPDDFGNLDTMLSLGKGGLPLFFGPPHEYLRYFSATDAPEVYRLLNHPESDRFAQLNQRFQQSASHLTINLDAEPTAADGAATGSAASQVRWLLARAFRLKLSDTRSLLLLLLQAPVIAILISVIFDQISVSVLFLLSLSAVWLGISNAAREVVGERPIFDHERLFGLRALPYIFSKLLLLAVPAVLQAVIFVVILAIRYAPSSPVLMHPVQMAAWLAGLTLCATTLGLATSAHARNTEQVTAAAPLLLLPQILLGGVLARISTGLVEVLSWMTFSRWGTEGLGNIQTKATTEIQTAAFSGLESASIEGDAKSLLQSQYLPAYADGSVFGEWTGCLALQAGMLGVLSLVFLLLMGLGLRRRAG